MLAFLTLPSTVGLLAVGVPVVRLLYERGKFTAADTEATAAALFLYAFGLVGYTGVKVLAPAFYALGRPRVPLAASLLAVATNLAVILAGHGALGYRAIALGTALGSLVNAALLVALFQKRVGGLFGHGLLRPVAGMVAAAVLMGAACRGLSVWLEGIVGTSGLTAQLATGLLPVGAGVVLYLALALAFKVGEAHVLLALLARRRREA
jgi:putative peptidoglycan lipid II flippase